MPRLSLKPDSSFFRKIVVGAVGARAVRDDMAALGHNFVELERGSTDSKLWKDVKRKRVRIPDLVCLRCGQRIESRAKTRNELAMSHSEQAERTWDFGMVPQDWIAFPVCEPVRETERTTGRLSDASSYWHERNWVQWAVSGYINYFSVEAFRSRLHARSRTKGVTEGTENFISCRKAPLTDFLTTFAVMPRINGLSGLSAIFRENKSTPLLQRFSRKAQSYITQ